MREHDALVSEYQHERHRPRESEALHTLRKVASLVKPIMRQRAWRVGTLCEFYPHQRNLLGLNINGGQKICLRLRYPSDQGQFIPLEQVVDTMLHEYVVHPVLNPADGIDFVTMYMDRIINSFRHFGINSVMSILNSCSKAIPGKASSPRADGSEVVRCLLMKPAGRLEPLQSNDEYFLPDLDGKSAALRCLEVQTCAESLVTRRNDASMLPRAAPPELTRVPS